MSTETSAPFPPVTGLEASDAALLQTLLQEAPLGFAFYGPDLRYRRINRTLADINGHSVEEHIGRRPGDLLAPERAEVVEEAVRRVLAEDRAYLDSNFSAEVPQGSGQVRHWASSWFPAHTQDGEISGVAVLTVDVTDVRRSEEAMRRSEERYRSLVRATAQIVWVASPDGMIREDSEEWRAITGQTLEEYEGDGWLDAVHPEDRHRVAQAWREAVRTGSVFDTSYRLRTRSGVYRHYETRAVPIVRGGEIIEWVGANTDVTATRDAEEMRERLTEQLSAAALRTARLQQATSMLAEALTVEHVVRVITEVGRSAIGADRSAVALLDEDRLHLRVMNDGLPTSIGSPGEVISLDAETVLSRAARDRKAFLAETPESLREQLSSEAVDTFLAHTDERAWVGLPLLATGAPLGALRFSFTRPRQISEEEQVFLEALAGQCALAVERAAFFERERKTAETLQHSLLPDKLPTLPGLTLGARYLPAAKGIQVGGDWYDAFPLPDGRLAVAVGDVMGKGVKAAAGMGRVRNALRALALSDPRPAAVLTGLDRLFEATEEEEQVTTVIYSVLNPDTGESLVSNAGHLPPLVFSPRRRPSLAPYEPGTPLGAPGGLTSGRSQETFWLTPGDTVVGYSDGLVENRNRGLVEGLEELVKVAAEAPPEVVADPQALVDHLVGRMLAGYEQDDDVTLLAIHAPPKRG